MSLFVARFIVSSILIGSFFSYASVDTKKGSQQLDNLSKRLSSVKKQKQTLQRQLNQKRRQAIYVRKDLREVDHKLVTVEEQLMNTTSKLKKSKREQVILHQQLQKAMQELEKKRTQIRGRLRQIYMRPEGHLMTSLVRSRSLGNLASRKSVLQRIASKDRALLMDLQRLYAEISQSKLRQDQLVGEVSQLAQKKRLERNTLESVKTEKKEVLTQLQKQQSILREELDALEAENLEITAKIRAYMASVRGTTREVTPYSGTLLRPVKGRVTSEFGYRMHPILKERRLHRGIDIRAASGTPIRAAAPGTIVEACYSRGYGNKVLIDHGGGMMTLYAHCSKLSVSPGQRVERGQIIGNVGSTGMSTGPHLHLEVRLNGQPVDPRQYL